MAITISPSLSHTINVHHLGLYSIHLDRTTPGLKVVFKGGADGDDGKTVIQSIPGVPFIRSAIGEDDFTEGYGTFEIIDHDFYLTTEQTIDSFTAYSASPALAPQLRFSVSIDDADGRYSKVFLTMASTASERIFGFGEQLTYFDLKGQKIPIMCREDGVGRGSQPTTWV
ncbi:hypothetical protein HDU76_001818, partial [Blyttiomyces sp. JEL0837]